jgi:hypothetical protein
MTETDLFQAYYNSISLAYATGQWWITVSTALVVATYFAAKHIPNWLFGIIILMYVLSATSSITEQIGYSTMAQLYGVRLGHIWDASHIPFPFPGGSIGGIINSTANIGVFVLGSIAAVAYSFITWRTARAA